MNTIGLLLVIALVCGMTGVSEAKRPNPAIDNTVILCAGPKEVSINSNPSSPVCVGTTVQFNIVLPCGWTFVSANWVFSGGTPGTGSGATPSTTYNSPGEDYNVTMTGMAKDQCGQSRSISGAMTITVFEVEKITVEPKKAIVEISKLRQFTATALDTEGNDVTAYIADKINWSVEGEIGEVWPTSGSSTTFFTAIDELPENKEKMIGRVIASLLGIEPGKASVIVIDLKVSITGRDFVLSPAIPWPGSLPKKDGTMITLEAEATPPGGKYFWVITEGKDKIRLVGCIKQSKVTIKGIKESDDKKDVEVTVIYTVYDDFVCSATRKLTVKRPKSAPIDLDFYNTHPTTEDKSGRFYRRIVRHTLKDQFGDAIKAKGILMGEKVEKIAGQGKWGITGKIPTLSNGTFDDILRMQTIFKHSEWYQIIKAGCRVLARLLLGGWDVGHFYITFEWNMDENWWKITKILTP